MLLPPSLRNRGVSTPIDIGFVIGALALLFVGWASHRSAVQLRSEALSVEHSYEVLRILDHLYGDLDRERPDEIRAHDDMGRLRKLVVDNALQNARADTLSGLVEAGASSATMAHIRGMQVEEQRLLRRRKSATDASAARSSMVIWLSTSLALVLMFVALALLHRDLRRRRSAEVAAQQGEAKYRLLMEQAADAIFIVDSDAVCVEVNEQAARMLGRPTSEIVGKPFRTFVRAQGSTAPGLPMLRYGHVTTGEFWIERANGAKATVEIRATMLEDGRIQIIARDISERKEVERVKDEFVSVVSHELRTPLTSIRGALGLLAAGRLDDAPEKRARMLQLAASNTDRLIRLINDILDIERMSSGGIAFERAELGTPELVSQAVDQLRPIADRAGVTIRADVEPLQVWADPDRMIQTLTNLLDNAIKYSLSGESIDIAVRRDGRFALFEVRDRGRGIPAGMQEAVFNRFQQVDNSDSREKGGTGLGLAICRSIVEQHGGRIWVESAPGEGSTFRFTIPLAAERLEGAGNGAARVLVCDDDPDLVEVLRATLSGRGYDVIGSHRADDALARVGEETIDVAVIDPLLPDGAGLRLVARVRELSGSTPIIVYTAADPEGAQRDFIRGMSAVIVTKARTSPDALADEVDRLAAAKARGGEAFPATTPE